MPTCPSCGEENPERAKFCWNCGSPLQASAGPAEERKVVTVLFCDLVGFTTTSDRADPEDVKARLRPFHARLKHEIEAHGGTLDKFIGDAALGVFGSPVAHEDDPERAVRTALSIVRGIDEMNAADPSLGLAVRVGVNTGEAVVAYGAGPQIGEAVTGDVVNTASRLQGVAPVGGIVVGEPTFRATREVFVYEPLPAVTVKGKAEALAIWRAVEARGRIGQDLVRTFTTPFVGRERERATLHEAFRRATSRRSGELVVVMGEPGAGKTRLVAELGHDLDATTDLVTWRRGRCLPYGEGVTFWALGEIVKSHAGILDSDGPDEAGAKLDAVIPAEEPDRQWLRQRLAPLVGVEATAADREESFTAWRRFLESIARTNPSVFVFDDIQWADEALLAFLEHVAGSRGEPMLIVCTARPDLRDRHPGWPALANATTVSLGPLSAAETTSLVSGMLDLRAPPVELQSLVLDRAGGNPLYAEEFVRMLRERGLLVTTGDTATLAAGAEVAAPDSIQALIAARLDAVGPARKAVLQDAAVMGEPFWAGAVAEMGGREPAAVGAALAELSGRQLVHPIAPSSLRGQDEYGFAHALIRDVAYAQIPRAVRAARHRSAATWIERAVPERLEDHAEVLAHHYTEALRLSRAAGAVDGEDDLLEGALRFLSLAGEHALGLDVQQGLGRLEAALELAPPGHRLRPRILVGWADAARQAGRFPEAAVVLAEAIEALEGRGDRVAAARARGMLSSVYLALGDHRQAAAAAEAVRSLEEGPPGPDLVAAYSRMAGATVVLGDHRQTIEWADRAVDLAGGLGVEVPARVLGFRGFARSSLGDPEGLADMRTALRLAVERGEGRDAAVLYNNLAVAVWPLEGPASVMRTLREGIEFSDRRGIREFSLTMTAASLDQLVELGEWDELLEQAAALDPEAEAAGDVATLLQVRWARARVLAARGRVEEARPLADWLVESSRESGGVEDVVGGLATAASVSMAAGDLEQARALVAEVEGSPNAKESPPYPVYLPGMTRAALAAGDLPLAQRLSEGVDGRFPYHRHALAACAAMLAEARGHAAQAATAHAESAAGWDRFGVVPERAHALLGQARCLVAVGDPAGAAVADEARALFERLGASPAVAAAVSLRSQTVDS